MDKEEQVEGLVDPGSHYGPYKSHEEMLEAAQPIHREMDEEDILFWMTVDTENHPHLHVGL